MLMTSQTGVSEIVDDDDDNVDVPSLFAIKKYDSFHTVNRK